MMRLASESCFYSRQKAEVAFNWSIWLIRVPKDACMRRGPEACTSLERKKMGEGLQSHLSPIFGELNTPSRISMDWVPCRVNRCCSRPAVGAGLTCEVYDHKASFLASASESDR
ncbi:hypothetical protein TNCV_4693711 [Trichonephila clavipes]|uniref:Uncharacterized protein n=1 Tax=Trichonephila clavipes TaxID=2585209 RepID=A0A8X6WBH6_TRICX|nr:hypothetical protein TNCV_4693711 [Trichonephila clavipes]